MSFVEKVKRAETPFYARVKRLARKVLSLDSPVPGFLLPGYRMVYRTFTGIRRTCRWSWVQIYRKPVTRSICASMGRRVRLEKIPAISGNVRVHLGDDVDISGRMAVNGGRVFPESTLRIGNRSFIGHMSTFMICREIVIGDDVLLAQGCYIADNSAHPLDADRRAMGSPPDPDSVRPVHIGNKVWVGRQSMILPGVTIGEGAVIGASSVVTKDIPPHTVWAGNPAKFIRSLVTNNTAASLEKV